jgi:hypothetical protein
MAYSVAIYPILEQPADKINRKATRLRDKISQIEDKTPGMDAQSLTQGFIILQYEAELILEVWTNRENAMHQRKALMRILKTVAVACFALIPASLPGQFIVRPVNLAYLARRAGVIVQGRVINVRYEPLPGYEHFSTVRVTLAVGEMLRGPQTKQYTFRQWMPGGRMHAGKYGAYQVGSELLLFLVSPSEYGLSSPIGAEQGKFRIQRDARGRPFIANGFGNNGIFRGVVDDAEISGLNLSPVERSTAAGQGAVDLDRFKTLVKKLMTLPRIE